MGNYADSSNILNAITQIEEAIASDLADGYKPRPELLDVLRDLHSKRDAAQAEIGEGNAAWRGFAHDATFGQLDTLNGVKSWAMGDGYKAGRDEVRNKDRMARDAYPDAFNSGQMAGAGASMALPAVGLLKGMQGASMGAKIGAGGLMGAMSGANQGIQEAQLDDKTTMGDYWDYGKWPMTLGAGIGAGVYPLAAGAGNVVRALTRAKATAPGMGNRAARVMERAIDRSERSGTDIRAYLNSLTGEATLADVPGAMQTTAKGLVAQGGTGGEYLAREITKRADEAGARIKADTDRFLGEKDAAFKARGGLADERKSVLGPQYEAALGADEIEIDKLLDVITESSSRSAGRASEELRKIGKALADEMGGDGMRTLPATKLHWLRADLGKAMRENPDLKAALGPTYGKMTEMLDSLDGYKSARLGYANNRLMADRIEEGRKVFSGGAASAMSPEELAEKMAGMSNEEREAFQKGAREWVYATMGTSRNDAAAAWGAFDKDWNAEKLALVLGEDDASELLKRLKSEAAFSKTRGKIAEGSETDFRTAAREGLGAVVDEDTGRRPSPVQRIKRPVDDALNRAIDTMIYGNRKSAANFEIGQALAAQGRDRDAILGALTYNLLSRQAPNKLADTTGLITDILLRGAGAAAVSNSASNK